MDYSLGEELNSMMRSVSKNIGVFDLDPEPLYTGSHGQIFHITNRHDRKSHVLKVFWKNNNVGIKDPQQTTYLSQKRIHQSLKNRYIVQLHNTFQDDNNSYLVLQYCEQGNLRTKMKQTIPIELVRDYGLQMAKGLAYLHKNQIIHGDIKPQNILLTAQNQIKLCDFGMAVKCNANECVKKFRGTIGYASPEAIELHNHKLDVWSLGCLLHEMATGKLPFAYNNWKELSTLITEEYLQRFIFNSDLSASLLHLLKKIFVYDKDNRPSIEEVMTHPFFTGEPLPLQVQTQKCKEKLPTKRSSSGKAMIRSLQARDSRQQNNQNKNKNKMNLPLKSTLPDYKKLLEMKFKKQEIVSKETAAQQIVHTSGDKHKSNLKDNIRSNTNQYRKVYGQGRQNTIDKAIREMSPLSTKDMIIKPLQIKHSMIEINERGYTRHSNTQNMWFNVSCNGRLIKIRSNQVQKQYRLQQLPAKYHRHYEEGKMIVRNIQSEQSKMIFFDAKTKFQMKVKYDSRVQVKLGEVEMPHLTEKDLLLTKNKAISDKDYNRIRTIYLSLISLSQGNQ